MLLKGDCYLEALSIERELFAMEARHDIGRDMLLLKK